MDAAAAQQSGQAGSARSRERPAARWKTPPHPFAEDYKDTDPLRKFISDRGKIRSRRVTCVAAQQQRRPAAAFKNAREMALLPYGSGR
ncbi:30S ribosomal protein S18 [Streptomyces sp. NPDC127069]|uniref:30S ribosomal protein S18 n=1 Tax=Streptomyces sp. NPDC127069 TaxID=3347128 RepID=UPI003652C247